MKPRLVLLSILAMACVSKPEAATPSPFEVVTDTILVCIPSRLPNGQPALFCRPEEIVRRMPPAVPGLRRSEQ